MAADQDERLRQGAADAGGQRQHGVGFERVHAGDADERGAAQGVTAMDRAFERREPQIGQRHAVPARFERGRDVLHAERFDAKKWAETEAFVARDGPK